MTTMAGLAPDGRPTAPETRVAGGTAVPAGPILAADGMPLDKKLAQVTRRARIRAFLLVVPLLVFVLIFFVAPIVTILRLSTGDTVIATELPRSGVALRAWDQTALPDEAVYAAMVADLKDARERQATGKIGAQINYVYSGARSLFVSAGRSAGSLEAPFKQALIDKDPQWGDPTLWVMIKTTTQAYTSINYLNALDRTLGPTGEITRVPEDQRIHVTIFIRTLWLSFVVTALCMLFGYPVAYLLAHLPLRISNLLMICVLLPFWTALLVRITAWIALLQNDGVILSAAVALGMVDPANRPQLVYNLIGTLVAMVHVLMPSMILPLYSVMKTIPPTYVRAARSLGATSFTAFWRVYFPQTLPGIAAGGLLVFILSVGYYITPALLGGQSGVLISNFIELHVSKTLNWGLAAALAGLLLVAILILYWLFNKIVGIDRLKMG
jgi:putative spermidine/putrescine transport system permease protein